MEANEWRDPYATVNRYLACDAVRITDKVFALGVGAKDDGLIGFFRRHFAHHMGHHKRRVELWVRGNGEIMRGTRCECGRLEDIRPLSLRAQENKKQGKYHWS